MNVAAELAAELALLRSDVGLLYVNIEAGMTQVSESMGRDILSIRDVH